MAKRGRKSQADLTTVSIAPRIGKPPPPADLTDDQTLTWRVVVDSMPADWFGRESLPILSAYCRHAARARFLALRLDSMSLADADEVPLWDKLAAAAERETRALLACARALRLTNQAKYDAGKASRLTQGQRPAGLDWSEAIQGDSNG